MIITEIASCKRNKNRVNIYADGQFAFALYLETAVQYGFKTGMDLDAVNMPEILDEDEKKFAMDTALHFLSYRARSSGEVRSKLKEKNVSAAGMDWTIAKIEEMGYLNDRVFAETLAGEYARESGKGRKFIEQKLFEKGVAKAIIRETLQNMEDQSETVFALAEKLYEKHKDEDKYKAKQKIYRALYSRGFDPDEIQKAVARLDGED